MKKSKTPHPGNLGVRVCGKWEFTVQGPNGEELKRFVYVASGSVVDFSGDCIVNAGELCDPFFFVVFFASVFCFLCKKRTKECLEAEEWMEQYLAPVECVFNLIVEPFQSLEVIM